MLMVMGFKRSSVWKRDACCSVMLIVWECRDRVSDVIYQRKSQRLIFMYTSSHVDWYWWLQPPRHCRIDSPIVKGIDRLHFKTGIFANYDSASKRFSLMWLFRHWWYREYESSGWWLCRKGLDWLLFLCKRERGKASFMISLLHYFCSKIRIRLFYAGMGNACVQEHAVETVLSNTRI